MLQISDEECQEILHRTKEFECSKFIKSSVKKTCDFHGFLGEYFQLLIFGLNENGVEFSNSYFAKSICITNKKQRKMLEETGIFLKECKLYGSLIKELSKNFREGELK